MERLWHPEHFICNHCKRPIKQTFQVADNRSYCVQLLRKQIQPEMRRVRRGSRRSVPHGARQALAQSLLHLHPLPPSAAQRRIFPCRRQALRSRAKRLDKRNQMHRDNTKNIAVDDQ
ncbi:hypothetical protein L596_013234 [Steinernema carpocapsae]|uniref:LIM zinc-binding domain-containing protein n=1 Tax=Steinernema carpocapsae TaxID=34508 RepID=A0A4U5NZK8_STECR|nr:hypothetical protein L596_013234 [Steinernema carpocapsae]